MSIIMLDFFGMIYSMKNTEHLLVILTLRLDNVEKKQHMIACSNEVHHLTKKKNTANDCPHYYTLIFLSSRVDTYEAPILHLQILRKYYVQF